MARGRAAAIALSLGVLILGALFGIASAWAGVALSGALSSTEAAGWRREAGAERRSVGPYARVFDLWRRPFSAPMREAMTLRVDRDETGARLDDACAYEVSGGALPARAWVLLVQDARGRPVRNGDGAWSFTSERAAAGPDAPNGWSVRVAPVRGDAPRWISSRHARRGFSIVLRLYQPLQAAREAPETIAFPRVSPAPCAGSV